MNKIYRLIFSKHSSVWVAVSAAITKAYGKVSQRLRAGYVSSIGGTNPTNNVLKVLLSQCSIECQKPHKRREMALLS